MRISKQKSKCARGLHLLQWSLKCFRLKAHVDANAANHRRITLLTGPITIALHLVSIRLFQQSVMSWYHGYFRWVTFARSQHKNADDFPDSLCKPGSHSGTQRTTYLSLMVCFIAMEEIVFFSFSQICVLYTSISPRKDKTLTSSSLLEFMLIWHFRFSLY